MAISFLGKEICTPGVPKCELCPLNSFCTYYKSKNQ
ncbi:hypothetical protein [Flavobacterium sp.]